MIAWLPTNWLARATWLLNQQKMWYGFRIVRLKLARESARRLQNVYGAQLRQYTDTFTPPTFSKLEVSERAPEISGYLTNGFIIRGNAVFGSVALLPRGFFNWKVQMVGDIVPESFALFHLIEPKLELVVLGTGSSVERINPEITKFLKRKGISIEIQDTPNACATFNFMLDEGRPAGAALIPPRHIPP